MVKEKEETPEEKKIQELESKVYKSVSSLEELEGQLAATDYAYRYVYSILETLEKKGALTEPISHIKPNNALASRLLSELYMLRNLVDKLNPDKAAKLITRQKIEIASLRAKLEAISSKKQL